MMRHLVVGAAAGTLGLLASSSAFADGGPAIELGARVGYALPMGDAAGGGSVTTPAGGTASTSGGSLSDEISGMIPLKLDAGVRIMPSLYVGLYFQYGLGFVPSSVTACSANVSCSVHDIMYGVDAHYHLMPSMPLDPWLGVGIGRESLTESASSGNVSADVTLTGWQFLDLQGGLDFSPSSDFAVGPFVSLSLGQYSSGSATGVAAGLSGDIQNTAMHEWLTIGVRGAYDIHLM